MPFDLVHALIVCTFMALWAVIFQTNFSPSECNISLSASHRSGVREPENGHANEASCIRERRQYKSKPTILQLETTAKRKSA